MVIKIQWVRRVFSGAHHLQFRLLRMGAFYWKLSKTVTALTIAGLCGAAMAQDMPVQESDASPGITKAEEAALYGGTNGQSAKFLQQFKAGRAQTGNTRANSIIFMHDDNFDGVTDHAESINNATRLEKLTGEAANKNGGKLQNKDGVERDEELQKWRDKEEEACRKKVKDSNDQKAKENIAAVCYQPSPNLKNTHAAHDGPLDEHRVYELTDDAKNAAKQAGNEYAKRTWAEAANYDYPNNKEVKQSSKMGKVIALNRKNGKETWEETDVVANPDLIRSEIAAAEEQKLRNLQQGAKFFKAKRISNTEFVEDHDLDKIVSSRYGNTSDPAAVAKADQEVAVVIAAKSVLANQKYCMKPNNTFMLLTKGSCPQGEKEMSYPEIHNMKDISSQDRIRQFQQAASQLDDKAKKSIGENAAKIVKCLQPGVWCNNKPGDANNKQFEQVKGDAGNAFKDTRAFNYDNAYRGALGGYDKNVDTVRSMDLNEGNSKDFNEFKKQAAEGKKEYKDFLDNERKKQADSGGKYKSPYLDKRNFDTQTMNARKLSGRNPGRGDGTFIGKPSDTPASANYKYSVPSGGAPSAPPAAQAPRGPASNPKPAGGGFMY